MDNRITKNYIKTAAETGSISLAAEQLGISQPALSSAIKKVEKELGTILLDRSRKPLRLTASGQAYLEYLSRISILDKELRQRIDDIETLISGSLTIGGASFFNMSYIPSAVAAFAERYPGIDIEIVDDSVPELMKRAQEGELDIFLTPCVSDDDSFEHEEFLEEKIFFCVPEKWQENRFLTEKAIPAEVILSGNAGTCSYCGLTKEELQLFKDSPFIMLGENLQIGQRLSEIFENYSLKPKRILKAEQTMTSLALTLAGIGISLVTETSIRNGNMKNFPAFYLLDSKSICTRKMYVSYLRNSYLSEASRKFIDILKKQNDQSAITHI